MEEFLDAPFPAFRWQVPDHIPILPLVDIPILPLDGRFWDDVLPLQRVFDPVLQNPDEYLMPRFQPFVELPDHWEVFSGNDYLGVQQHLQEELNAPEQVEDMDDEEEDLDDKEETMDCTKTSSQDVDAMSSASQHVRKRADSTTDDDQLLKNIGSSSCSVSAFGLQDSAMPNASPTAFGPILEPLTASEVQNLNI